MNKGNFKKGHIPWNKGKKGIHCSPRTEFKKGIHAMENSPSWKGGIQYPKNDCVHITISSNVRVRRPRVVYEEHFGPVPEGYVIYHLDGDRTNDDPYNLEAISRAESMRRTNYKKS
jgi:hypothetical protein